MTTETSLPDSATRSSGFLSTKRNALWRELTRRHPHDPHAWAMAHRRIRRTLPEHLPWLADLARDDHPVVVVQKAAQVGVSEMLTSLALWAADTAYAGRGHVLYLLPTQTLSDDFAQGRLDRAIQDSPYLRGRVRPEPPRRKTADNKRVKGIGPGLIYLRGAESRRQVASIDADLVVLDEYDQMDDAIHALAEKRLGSSRRGLLRLASTPRLPEAGINALYRESDQRRYFLPCPACHREQPLVWPENVDRERALVVCRTCRAPMDLRATGRWVPAKPGNVRMHGYHLNKLYSPWADIGAMLWAADATTPAQVQEFQNSDLGETYAPPGGGLSLHDLDACRSDYGGADYAGEPCDMGVDVGLRLHVVIREHASTAPRFGVQRPPRLWFAGEVGWPELETLAERYNVRSAVIDALPEGSRAREFAQARRGDVRLAHYGRQQSGHQIVDATVSQPAIDQINRTEALDEVMQRFRDRAVALPRDARQLGGRFKDGLGEYYREVLAPQRTLERDATGNWVARWLEHGKDDHYAHAELYCMRAAERPGGRVHRIRRF